MLRNEKKGSSAKVSLILALLCTVGSVASGIPKELAIRFTDSNGRSRVIDSRQFHEENRFHRLQLAPPEPQEQLSIETLAAESRNSRAPAGINWAHFQTGIRNQLDRNTCSIFGMVAAIEARYRRQFGIALDLSEQFAWHMFKSTGVSHPKIYRYENQSSYWGGGGSHGVRELSNFAFPLESAAPYQSGAAMDAIRRSIPGAGLLAWMPSPADNRVTQDEVDAFEYSPRYIPVAARAQAKYGVESYRLLDRATVRNTTAMEELIAAGNEVIVDVRLNWRLDAGTGILQHDPAAGGGDHVFLIVGYERARGFYYVKNSWGESDYLKVGYSVIQNEAHSGSIVTAVTHPDRPRFKNRSIGVWNMDHDGWKGKLIVRRTTNESNGTTRLGHYHAADGRRLAVNGFTTDNGRGLTFTIENSEYPSLTQMAGQRFETHLYSWDIHHAAGFTTWEGSPFGVYLTRLGFSAPYSSSFDRNEWVGSWNMNHDGWQGRLLVSRIERDGTRWRVVASYTANDGTVKPVTGHLATGKDHVAQLEIAFSSGSRQPFTLHYHGWVDGLFSGYTTWAGNRFGVHGIK